MVPADTDRVRTLPRDRTTERLLDDEEQLAALWCTRFRADGHVPRLAADLLHAVLLAVRPRTADTEDAALSEAAYGLGVLRAQQGNDTVALVEDVLALRTLLWGHVAALPELEGDAAQLLLLQTRVSDSGPEVDTRRAYPAGAGAASRTAARPPGPGAAARR